MRLFLTYGMSCLAAALAALAAPLAATPEPQLTGRSLRHYPAAEARQGVAAGKDRFYAIDNRTIAAYDRKSGAKLASWSGEAARFTHLNSCIVDGRKLVCAHSNYPGVPMASTIESFDAETLRHLSSRSIGARIGSLTWLVRHRGSWWAGFANYDGKGGTPGRDHRFTALVRYDQHFIEIGRWRFPASVLARFAPKSSSGGTWGDDELLYVTGHDRPEVYVMALPATGDVLNHVETIGIETAGQAISWDPVVLRQFWSIDRATARIVVTQLPAVPARNPS